MTSKQRYLHGTLKDHEPSIRKHGLVPGKSDYSHQYYDKEDTEDAVFMAHEKEPKRAFSSIRGQIGRKLNKHPAHVTSDDIEKHGAMFVSRGDEHDTYHKTEDGYGKNSRGGYDDNPPNHAETGDYYSRHDTSISGKLTGKRLVKFLRKRKLTESTKKEDITESFRFLEKVHRNPPMDTIKNIAKHSEHGQARISIDHDGTLWAGAAERFLHDQFGKEQSHGNAKNQHSYGWVFHKDGKYSYGARHRADKSKSRHTMLDKFHKAGIYHVNHEVNEEDLFNEDAPTVNIGGGAIAGAGIGPQGEPGRNNKLGLMRRKLDVINKVKKAKLETV